MIRDSLKCDQQVDPRTAGVRTVDSFVFYKEVIQVTDQTVAVGIKDIKENYQKLLDWYIQHDSGQGLELKNRTGFTALNLLRTIRKGFDIFSEHMFAAATQSYRSLFKSTSEQRLMPPHKKYVQYIEAV